LVVASETVDPSTAADAGELNVDGGPRRGTDVVESMVTVRSSRAGSSSQEFIVPMMVEAPPPRRPAKRHGGGGGGGGGGGSGGGGATLEEDDGLDRPLPPVPSSSVRDHQDPTDQASSANGIEMYEPYEPFNSSPAASTNTGGDENGGDQVHGEARQDDAGSLSSSTNNEEATNAMAYSDPASNQQLYTADGGTSDTAAQNYSDPAPSQQMYAGPSGADAGQGDYVNSGAVAGIVGIIGAPPNRAQVYENSMVEGTNA
jgi:hypothetical protein